MPDTSSKTENNSTKYKTTLVVMLHAYAQDPESLVRAKELVTKYLNPEHVFAPAMPAKFFSMEYPDSIANKLVSDIEGIVEDRQTNIGNGFDRIILVGHSFGAIMARKIWALAHGARPDGTVDSEYATSWANNIDRLVLLAAMGRGWMISSAQGPWQRLLWTLGTAYGNLRRYFPFAPRDPLIFGLRRGAPFLTTTRIQCLAVEEELRKSDDRDLPIVVQLLGTNDDYVAPADNVDLATGQNFYYLEVKEASHKGIVYLNSENAEKQFLRGLTGNVEVLKEEALDIEDVFDIVEDNPDSMDVQSVPFQNKKIKHVVFVIHGIRDAGFGMKRIARRINSIARSRSIPCHSVTSTYGYFPMGPFLLPWMRRAKVEWLLDQYVTAQALYPGAVFDYVGHSNGTYLLAKAMELCPAARFQAVVFAGSVVRTKFKWDEYMGGHRGQVQRVVNYVATNDQVVAIFPNGLEKLRLQDLGGAGHAGFEANNVANVRHVSGGHGAALSEDTWDEMAEFILENVNTIQR